MKIIRLNTRKPRKAQVSKRSSQEEIEYKVDKLVKKVDELQHEVEASRKIIRLLALLISSQKVSFSASEE